MLQDQALATFNFLNSERRYVAGAFIPPEYTYVYTDEDAGIKETVERTNIYETKTDYHVPQHSVEELHGWEEQYEKAKQRVFSGAKTHQMGEADGNLSGKGATSKKDKTEQTEKP